MAEEVRINFTSSADTSGADKMGAAVGGLSTGAEKAAAGIGATAKESKAMASDLGRGVEIGNAAVATFQNIAASSGGGASSLIAFTRAGFGVGTMFKGLIASMGPFGIAAAAIGVAVGVISSVLKKSEEAAAEAKKKFEELNKLSLEDFRRQFADIETWAGNAKRAIDDVAAAADRVADKKLAAELAELQASQLPDDVKKSRESQLRQRREDEKRQGVLTVLQGKAKVDQDALFQEQQVQSEVEAKLNQQLAALQELRAARAEEGKARAAVDYAGPEGYSPEQRESLNVAQARLAAAEEAAKGFSEETVNQIGAAMKDAVEKVSASASRAAVTTAAATRERETQKQEDPYIARARSAESKSARGETPEEKAAREAEKKRAEERADWLTRQTPASALAQRIANGMEVDIESAKRVYPLFKFPENPAAPAAPSAATQPPASGGTITGPGGLMQTFPAGGLPQGPGRGVYQEPQGAGGGKIEGAKEAEDAAKRMETSLGKASEQELPDFAPAADAADVLSSNVQSFATQTIASMGNAAKAMGAASELLGAHTTKITSHDQEFVKVWGAISSMRTRMNAARVA